MAELLLGYSRAEETQRQRETELDREIFRNVNYSGPSSLIIVGDC